MFDQFTPRARQVIILARKEADRFNHDYIGTEHLLLGLVKLGQGVAMEVLREMGVDFETLRLEIERAVGSGPDDRRGHHHLHSLRRGSRIAGHDHCRLSALAGDCSARDAAGRSELA